MSALARQELNRLGKSIAVATASSHALYAATLLTARSASSVSAASLGLLNASVRQYSSQSQSYSYWNSSRASTSTELIVKKSYPNYFALIRGFSSEVKAVPVPGLGDSITEGTVVSFTKAVGEAVQADEVVAVLETDKVSVDIRSPAAGAIAELCAKPGDTIKVGDILFKLTLGAAGTTPAPAAAKPADAPKKEAPKAEAPKQEAPKAAAAAPKQDAKPAAGKSGASAKGPAISSIKPGLGSRNETRVPMTRIRMRIAERLKDAQNTYALLTTFNEIDMSNAMNIRSKYKDDFQKKHGSKLGFMSFFVKAATNALMSQPNVNAAIDGKDIVYRDFVDISVAVATPTGLVVPVLRNTEQMSFNDVEVAIAALGEKARKGQIAIEDMTGGTFTISNGGVYGSLMGTPIVNPPQSAILGMHGIFKRPVVVDDKIEIRPMMYVALTYDHRLLDGSDAVTFLRKIKDNVEDPVRLLLDV